MFETLFQFFGDIVKIFGGNVCMFFNVCMYVFVGELLSLNISLNRELFVKVFERLWKFLQPLRVI